MCEIRAGRSCESDGGSGGSEGGTGRSIVTYIKIPISRLVITSTVYHAKQGR